MPDSIQPDIEDQITELLSLTNTNSNKALSEEQIKLRNEIISNKDTLPQALHAAIDALEKIIKNDESLLSTSIDGLSSNSRVDKIKTAFDLVYFLQNIQKDSLPQLDIVRIQVIESGVSAILNLADKDKEIQAEINSKVPNKSNEIIQLHDKQELNKISGMRTNLEDKNISVINTLSEFLSNAKSDRYVNKELPYNNKFYTIAKNPADVIAIFESIISHESGLKKGTTKYANQHLRGSNIFYSQGITFGSQFNQHHVPLGYQNANGQKAAKGKEGLVGNHYLVKSKDKEHITQRHGHIARNLGNNEYSNFETRVDTIIKEHKKHKQQDDQNPPFYLNVTVVDDMTGFGFKDSEKDLTKARNILINRYNQSSEKSSNDSVMMLGSNYCINNYGHGIGSLESGLANTIFSPISGAAKFTVNVLYAITHPIDTIKQFSLTGTFLSVLHDFLPETASDTRNIMTQSKIIAEARQKLGKDNKNLVEYRKAVRNWQTFHVLNIIPVIGSIIKAFAPKDLELRTAALELIVSQDLGAVTSSSCKSGKDREPLLISAMQVLRENPRVKGDDFMKAVLKQYLIDPHNMVQSGVATGVEGNKVLYEMYTQKEIIEAQEFEKDSKIREDGGKSLGKTTSLVDQGAQEILFVKDPKVALKKDTNNSSAKLSKKQNLSYDSSSSITGTNQNRKSYTSKYEETKEETKEEPTMYTTTSPLHENDRRPIGTNTNNELQENLNKSGGGGDITPSQSQRNSDDPSP